MNLLLPPTPTPTPEPPAPAPEPTPTPTPEPIPCESSCSRWATTSLNVRSGPGTTYGVVGGLSSGQEVTVLGTLDSWAKISETTWVSASYLSETKPAPAPVAPAPAKKEAAPAAAPAPAPAGPSVVATISPSVECNWNVDCFQSVVDSNSYVTLHLDSTRTEIAGHNTGPAWIISTFKVGDLVKVGSTSAAGTWRITYLVDIPKYGTTTDQVPQGFFFQTCIPGTQTMRLAYAERA